MTREEALKRAAAVIGERKATLNWDTLSGAIADLILAVERETAIRCCDIATEPTGRTDRRYRYPNEIVAEIRAAFNLEVR